MPSNCYVYLGLRSGLMSQFHQDLIQLSIAYTCLGVFIFTAVATCLSLIGWVEFTDKSQQKKLFYALIIEVVFIAVTFFGGVLKFDPKSVSTQAEKSILKSAQEKGVIYIQVPDREKGKDAEKLQSFLVERGYVAPGIEVVGSARSPQSSEIRYFYKSQAGRAEKLRTEISAFGLKDFKVENIKGVEDSASPDVLEVWYKK